MTEVLDSRVLKSGVGADKDASAAEMDVEQDLRQRITAMRQAKKEQLEQTLASAFPPTTPRAATDVHPQTVGLSIPQPLVEDRFSWVGVEDGDEDAPSGRTSRTSELSEEDSTVHGHHPKAFLPILSSTTIRPSIRTDDAQRRWRPSTASEHTLSSGASTSHGRSSQDDDVDGRSSHTATTVEDHSDCASKQPGWSDTPCKRRSATPSVRSGTAPSIRSTSSASARPLGPPPDLPLPPKPTSSASGLPSPITGWRYSSQSSRSVSTSSSVAHEMSKRSSKASSSRASSRLSRNVEINEDSDNELDSIRRISAFFPPPGPPPVNVHAPSRSSHSRAGSSSGGSTRSHSRNGFRPPSQSGSRHRSITSPRFSSPLQSPSTPKSPATYRPSDQIECVIEDALREAEDDEASESDLSEVLHITAAEGILANRQKASPIRAGQMAKIGLGLVSSNASMSTSPSVTSPASSRPHSTNASTPQSERHSSSHPAMHGSEDEERRESLLRKSMNGLVAALDLEAARWSFDSQGNSPQSVQLQSPATTSNSPNGPQMPAAIALQDALSRVPAGRSGNPEMVASSSQSRLQPAAELVDEAKTPLSQPASHLHSQAPATLSTSISAPTLLVEDADASEASLSDLDVSADEGVPRKRTKQARRRRGLGFEDQRASPSRGSNSRSLQPGHLFKPRPFQPAPAIPESDPYTFYEFSPSLPPFVPTGLLPKDLTGTGTWSSIVARANDVVSRQNSVSSFASIPASNGPISLKEIAAGARAKKQQAEAARKARESQSNFFATLSYKPFEMHQHAKEEARTLGRASSLGTASSRSIAMSRMSASSSLTDLASKWPVAIGEGDQDRDHAVGTEIASARSSLVGLGIASASSPAPSAPTPAPAPVKVYAEFSMQTSPAPTPPASPKTRALQVLVGSHADEPHRTPVAAKRQLRRPTRRKTMADMSAAYGIDLDTPGLKAPRLRAPRLSSRNSDVGLPRTRPSAAMNRPSGAAASRPGKGTAQTQVDRDEGSDSEESDLDLDAPLEELATRTGVLDEIRGAKRKLKGQDPVTPSPGPSQTDRRIATIPSRVRSARANIGAMQRPRRTGSATGWTSSEDDSDEEEKGKVAASRETPLSPGSSGKLQLRPLLLQSAPARPVKSKISSLRDSASGPWSPTTRFSSRDRGFSRSPSSRAASPELSSFVRYSDTGDDSLMSAELDMSAASSLFLDGDADFSPRAASIKGTFPRAASLPKLSSRGRAPDSIPSSPSAKSGVPRGSLRSAATVPEEAIETLKEEFELLSAGQGQARPSSSGHETISDSCGTSGHDPQRRPNEVIAEIVRQRLALRVRGILSDGARMPSDRAAAAGHVLTSQSETAPSQPAPSSGVAAGASTATESVVGSSPAIQDTPDTMVGSEIWSSFHSNDRSSSGSTATTWSNSSFTDEKPNSQLTLGLAPQLLTLSGEVESSTAEKRPSSADSLVAGTALEEAPTRSESATQPKTAVPAAPQAVSRSLHRKTSALPTLSIGRRAGSEAAVASPSQRIVAAASDRSQTSETGKASLASVKPAGLKTVPRSSLPSPASALRQPVASAAMIGGNTTPSRLRKMKSFGDRSSLSFVPPPRSTLPRAVTPSSAKALAPSASVDTPVSKASMMLPMPPSAPITPRRSTTFATSADAASSLPRTSGISATNGTASRLVHQKSVQGLSRLPTRSTPARPTVSPRPSGLPIPSGGRLPR